MFVCILPEKVVPEMTYSVLGGTLNRTVSDFVGQAVLAQHKLVSSSRQWLMHKGVTIQQDND